MSLTDRINACISTIQYYNNQSKLMQELIDNAENIQDTIDDASMMHIKKLLALLGKSKKWVVDKKYHQDRLYELLLDFENGDITNAEFLKNMISLPSEPMLEDEAIELNKLDEQLNN